MIQSGAAAEDQVSQVMSREDGKRVDSRQAEKGLQRDSRGITTLLPSPRVALSGSAVTKFKQGEALQAWAGLGLFSNRERAKQKLPLGKELHVQSSLGSSSHFKPQRALSLVPATEITITRTFYGSG